MKKRKKLIECKSIPAHLTEEAARLVDDMVKDCPNTDAYRYRKITLATKSEEVRPDERTDVAMVTTDSVDLDGEIVVPDGLDLSAYERTMIVLWNHDHDRPIGRAIWIKHVPHGVKAATKYADRPTDWDTRTVWLADYVWECVKQGVIVGKSIGFKPLEMREPTPEEVAAHPNLRNVITKAVLAEYSTVSVPCNPDAVIEVVKSLPVKMTFSPPKKRVVKAAPKAQPFPYRAVAERLKDYELEVDEEAIVDRVLRQYRQRGRL